MRAAGWTLLGSVGVGATALVRLFTLKVPEGADELGAWHFSQALAILAAFAFAYALMRASLRLYLSEDSIVEIERAQVQGARNRKRAVQDQSPPAELVKAIGEAVVDVAKAAKGDPSP